MRRSRLHSNVLAVLAGALLLLPLPTTAQEIRRDAIESGALVPVGRRLMPDHSP